MIAFRRRARIAVIGLLAAGLPAQAAWPPSTAGLVFLWENGEASNTVPTSDGIGRLCRLVPEAAAVFDRFWAMDLNGGAFRAEADTNALLHDAIRDSEAFTIEAVLTRTGEAAEGFYEIMSFGLSIGAAGRCNASRPEADACRQHGFVLGGRFNLVLFGLAGPQSQGSRVFDVGFQLGERPRHVLITYNSGQLDIYLDGEPRRFPQAGFDLSSSADAALAFGARPGTWNGSVERVALYTRAFSAADAAAHYNANVARLAGRSPLPVLEVDARLVEKRRIPRAEVYPNSLVVYDYRVSTVREGDYGDEKILVAHRGNLNGKRNRVVGDLVVGRRYLLNLEPFEGHPELGGLQMVGNDEDWHLPLFYAVSEPTAAE
ncbi:MAG: hypothetical protein OXH15_18755 [Gammaproteobacteria bacterium]|nr:hypothetical protein [Gammaproteobacteria bacterium]